LVQLNEFMFVMVIALIIPALSRVGRIAGLGERRMGGNDFYCIQISRVTDIYDNWKTKRTPPKLLHKSYAFEIPAICCIQASLRKRVRLRAWRLLATSASDFRGLTEGRYENDSGVRPGAVL
jgi:hypothetical protein